MDRCSSGGTCDYATESTPPAPWVHIGHCTKCYGTPTQGAELTALRSAAQSQPSAPAEIVMASDYIRTPDRLTQAPRPCCAAWTRDQGCPLHGDRS